MNSDLRKMQSEMISKPWKRFSSICASIDTEVDRILDRLLRGNKPHAYLLSHFLRSLIFKRNDTLCPCRSCHEDMTKDLQAIASGTGITSSGQYVQPKLGFGRRRGDRTKDEKLICEGEVLPLFFKRLAVINR